MKTTSQPRLWLSFVAVMVAALLFAPTLHAKARPIGDITLLGSVERDGLALANDSTIFEGDTIRTNRGAGGVIRVSGGRIELGELSELRIANGAPLRLILKSGSVAFNVATDSGLEILTPKIEIHPSENQLPGSRRLTGRVSADTQLQEDRFGSTSGAFDTMKRMTAAERETVRPGQTLIASLVPLIPVNLEPTPEELPQAQGGAAIAQFETVSGEVRLQRFNTTTVFRISQPGMGLASGDRVTTLQGQADIRFVRDRSLITLNFGTSVVVAERPQPTGFLRTISQSVGNLWFNIQRATGTSTRLETPTAVAAIRGTEGTQEVPNDTQSTHALNEGEELITERETNQSVTIRTGQRVTAIRGVGFTPIVALLAAIPKPAVGAGGGGGAAGGGAGGAAGGGAAGTATAATAATTTTVSSTVAAVTAAGVGAGALTTAAVVPLAARNEPPRASPTAPLNIPGGG